MSRFGDYGSRLYRGEVSYDFVGKRNRWYAISAILIILSFAAIFIKGLDYGIEFQGGAVFIANAPNATVEQARDALQASGIDVGEPTITRLSGGTIEVETRALENFEDSTTIRDALAEGLGIEVSEIDRQVVGPSWGAEITKKAITGLIIFLIVVSIYLALTFDLKMSIAAIVALFHDVIVTAGIYALIGFEVTPSTVIGLLTILGYSLYDTVVVFDKVRENTRGILGSNRWTYGQAANLAVNQTLVRSINTSIVALLPVLGMLIGGVFLVGVGSLNDLALVLLIGMAAGAYSSIFIATPFLVQIKELEPAIKAQKARVEARQALAKTDRPTGDIGELPGSGSGGRTLVPATRGVVETGARTQPKKVSRERRSSRTPPKSAQKKP